AARVAQGAGQLAPRPSTRPTPQTPEAAQPPPNMPGVDPRLTLAVQVILQVARDDQADAEATAATIASILGDDGAAALADEANAVEMFCAQWPQRADQRDFLAAVHAALQGMFATDDEPPQGGDVPDAQPATSPES